MGSKRGRLLIRQPRVKKESDPIIGHSSPDIDLEHSAYITTTTTTRYLQIPPKIERHASEPAPSTITLLSPNLLSVPQPSFLVKQHSHPVLPSQSQSPPQTTYTLQRQLSYPVTSTSAAAAITTTQLSSDNTIGISSQLAQLVATSIKTEEGLKTKPISPTVVIVTDPMTPTSEHNMPSIRVKTEELQRSISTPQTITRELSIENPRSSHCPILRDGPALGCNFCWNTIDGHGRILRRKTKYHCPECQTNLCIVPCFQEYHERQANDITNNENNTKTSATATLRHYPKTGSL